MDIVYVDVLTWEFCGHLKHFRFLNKSSFIGQFVHPVGGDEVSRLDDVYPYISSGYAEICLTIHIYYIHYI